VREMMVLSAVNPGVVIWMIVRFLDLMENQVGVVAVGEDEDSIHVVDLLLVVEDTMIVAAVVEEDTTVAAMENLAGEGVVEVDLLLDLTAVEEKEALVLLRGSLLGDEVAVLEAVQWAEWDHMDLLLPVEVTALD
jgi:hypothetical protein